MVARGVVRHEVDEDAQSKTVCLVDEERGVVEGAVPGVDVAVVRHVVAAVGQWRGVPRTDPHGVDAE